MHDDWQLALQLLHALLTFAGGIYLYVADRHRAHRTELEGLRLAHDERLRKLEETLSAARERIAHLPALTEFTELVAGVREMRAELRATMPPVLVRLARIEDFLQTRSLRA